MGVWRVVVILVLNSGGYYRDNEVLRNQSYQHCEHGKKSRSASFLLHCHWLLRTLSERKERGGLRILKCFGEVSGQGI